MSRSWGSARSSRTCRGIVRRVYQLVEAVLAAKPDVLVIVDSPDLTHRGGEARGAAAAGAPDRRLCLADGVGLARLARAKRMRAYVDHVLALLPFEPAGASRGSAGRPAPMSAIR